MRTLLLLAVAGLVACSSQPRTAATAATVQSPASSPQQSAQPMQANAQVRNAVAPSESEGFDPPPGYKPRTRDGQTLYCRRVVVLGSRFPKEICMTQAQLEEHERSNQAMRDDMSQHVPLCTSAAGCVAN